MLDICLRALDAEVVGGVRGIRLGGAIGSGCSTTVSGSVVRSMSGNLGFLDTGERKIVPYGERKP